MFQSLGNWFKVLALLIFLVPIIIVQKAVHQTRTVVVDSQLDEEAIVLIAVEESSWNGIDATGCHGHLSPRPIAVMDRGRRSLYAVEEGYRLPEPWVTPKYVWVRKYDDGDVSYNALYDVFRTSSQVEEWCKRNGYEGTFSFHLQSLAESVPDQESGRPLGQSSVPDYNKGQSSINCLIYTGRYLVDAYNLYERDPQDESFPIYERLAR